MKVIFYGRLLAMLPRRICHLLLTYELQNFQRFSKQLFFASNIDHLSAFFLKFECFQCKECVANIKCIRIEQVWCYECIDCCLYQVVFSLFYTLQRWFRNVKAFDKTIEFFHDVYRETLQLQPTTPPPPPPQTSIWRFSWKNRYVRLPLARKLFDKFTSEISPCYENNMKSYTAFIWNEKFPRDRGLACWLQVRSRWPGCFLRGNGEIGEWGNGERGNIIFPF